MHDERSKESNFHCDGELSYRGYNIKDLVIFVSKGKRFVFEEGAYLLLFGEKLIHIQ